MQVHRLTRTDDPALVADVSDRAGDEAVILLHGAGESRHIWGPIARSLATLGHRVISLDLRGHGESENAPDGDYRLSRFVDDLRHAMDTLGVQRATLVGRRLGGVIALAASAAPWGSRVQRIAMIDIGLNTSADRRDSERALIRADAATYATLAEAAAVIAMHRPRLQSEANLRRVLQQNKDGRWSWRCDPAFTKAPPGQRVDLDEDGPLLASALKRLSSPAILVRAAAPELLTSEHARELTSLTPHLRFIDIAHEPDQLASVLARFTESNTAYDPSGPSFDQGALRRALGCFATGVAILTTTDADGRPVGLTANSFCSVSLDPPLVLFCLDRRAGSLPAFERAESFAVNILHSGQRDISNRFVAKNVDRFADTGWETWEAAAPIIQDAMVKLECAKHTAIDGGDHRIFIGRVRDLWFDAAHEPLLYFQGQYRRLETKP